MDHLAPTGPFTKEQIMTLGEPRQTMVKNQLVARGIANPGVLRAMEQVPRHLFVPPERYGEAYEDRPLPIGYGQTISQPYMVALMTQWLAPSTGTRVLEIGAGSGYQTAILAEHGCHVTAIERVIPLAKNAYARLKSLAYGQIDMIIADGSIPCFREPLFDRILIAAACPEIPWNLTEMLRTNGILVAPVGGQEEQRLLILRRLPDGHWRQQWNTPCRFVPLIGRQGWPEHGG